MHDSTQIRNHIGFWRKFAVALIDGIILNTGLGIILAIITSVIGNVNLPNFDAGTCEIILGLVYFAALDSFPKQPSVGKKVVEITFNHMKANRIPFTKVTTEYLSKIISNVT